MEVKISPKIPSNFSCSFCYYNTSNKKDYDKHLLTLKHKKMSNGSIQEEKNSNIFICECKKQFNTHGGLWKHKQKCQNINTDKATDSNNIIDVTDVKLLTNMVLEVVKQNNETQKQNQDLINKLYEICKNGTTNTTNNHTNSHNKSFNLQFFLNETCKNAMNITEFVDSLQLQMSDLENVGEAGYIEGISSIIIKKLNTLDITERPIHCTDKKRETMYIKDQDKWEKEDEKKTKMHKLVTKVANKNINMISEFQKLHPEWKKCSSKYADQHNKIVIESMGGKGDNEYEKQEKIIKKIAKEVFVEK
jgi:Txe/YoeB family toxin of Txe-Axe toxin-antitoxin module